MKTVLITGGTGLVGSRLSILLDSSGYKVIHLSRKENLNGRFPAYKWDVEGGTVDNRALQQADFIVHLAGAGVADGAWTKRRKQLIIDSRVKSAALLQRALRDIGHQPKAVICASASGFYGNRGAELLDETASKGEGFLADVVEKWEAASLGFQELGLRTVLLRIGIVLSSRGGALQKMLPTYNFRIGAYFGSGQQFYSWVHLDDLCAMFLHAIENQTMQGIYNAVAPNAVTNKDLAAAIGTGMGKSVFLTAAPAPVMRLAMGEMADVVLDGVRLSPEKIRKTGFDFTFVNVDSAIRDLLERKI